MLSFELSAIDFILIIAVIVLLGLYLTKLSAKTPNQEKSLVEEKISGEPAIENEFGKAEAEEKRLLPEPPGDSTKCPYGVGYLKRRDKDASYPDKCLSCSKIMNCYSADE